MKLVDLVVPGLWVIVTCMGRKHHLRHTASALIEQDASYCLVDFSCPDRAGDWLVSAFRTAHERGKVRVVGCPGERYFHKARAQNLGARSAIEYGARLLCFADADTLFGPGTLRTMASRLGPGQFMVAARTPNGAPQASLTGLLLVTASDFHRAGGYDEAFTGWGSEDVAMRLQLHLLCGLTPVEAPRRAVRAIPHSNELRTRYAAEKNLAENARRNETLLETRVRQWTGKGLDALSDSARALLFR